MSTINENYEKLMPVVERLYQHTDSIAHMALLPLFLLSVLMAFSKDLGIEGAIVTRLKRLVVTMLLLAAFPSLTGLIKNLGQEVALSIDNLDGIDAYLKAASKRAQEYSLSIKSLLDFGNDLIVSSLVTISYVILFVARYFLVAFYHFYWMILVVTGPLLILGTLFESSSTLTKNLFKNLMLVASWPIVWAMLSAFLKALPFQDAYAIDGGYTAIVVMNLILAMSLLFSPFMLGQFCEGAIVGTGTALVSSSAKALQNFALPKLGLLATQAGEKLYPHAQKLLPTRSSVSKFMRNQSTNKSIAYLLMLIPLMGFSESINVRVGLSSVVCFQKAPDSIAIGDARYFQAQRIGNNLLLRSSVSMKESNLLIFSGGSLSSSYKLYSDPILPHSESVDCKPSLKEQAQKSALSGKTIKPIPVKRESVLSHVENNGLRAELLRKAWESPKRDYFTLQVRLVNKSKVVWVPDWSKIVLKQDNKSFSHTGLSSERREVQVGATVEFELQFTRPEMASNRGHLVIPSKHGTLELLVEKGAVK